LNHGQKNEMQRLPQDMVVGQLFIYLFILIICPIHRGPIKNVFKKKKNFIMRD